MTFTSSKKYIRVTLSFLINFLFFIVFPSSFNYIYAETSTKHQDTKNNFFNDEVIETQYLLGVGDVLSFQIKQLPIGERRIFIGPDGTINLPDIESFNAIGLTVNELKDLLTKKYSQLMFDPEVKLYISSYRPVNIYIYGEVIRPGIYTLSGHFKDFGQNNSLKNQVLDSLDMETSISINPQINSYQSTLNPYKLPTLYDAIRASQGLTPYSDLSQIVIIRENSKSDGGGKIKTTVDFWKLFEEGDLGQNIRLQDGDSIFIAKSKKMLSEEHLKISSYNLSPNFIRVYLSGNIKKPGEIIIPQGSSLVQAIARAGGKEVLSGDVEFIRFDRYSFMEKRKFRYNPKAKANSYKNPILISGDIVNIRNSALGYSSKVLSKVTSPLVGIYTLLNIVEDI